MLIGRIRSRLVALDISEREASRRAGFSLGYVNEILAGRSKSPGAANLIKLASALECDLDYLIGSQDAPRSINEDRSFSVSAQKIGGTQRLIDLYSSPSLSNELWTPISAGAVDKVPVIPALSHVDGAYAWSICNRHMEPRYFVGEIVYVHPGLPAREGDFVFAKNRDGRVGVARLLKFGAMVTFSYLSGETCSVAVETLEFIHRIVGSAG